MRPLPVFTLLLGLAAGACVFPAAGSAATDEPLFDALVERFRTPSLRVTALLQLVADFQRERSFPGNNGFSVANARLGIAGRLDRGFDYLMRANFSSPGGPSILDARLSYAPNRSVAVDVGQFKVPFSREFLTGAGTIDFVNRAQVVSALAPGRQIGVQVRGGASDDRVGVAAGLWNGNAAGSNGNDDQRFLYAARLTVRPMADASGPGALELGANVAGSNDARVTLVGGRLPDFAGRRRLIGADLRWSEGPWLASVEVIAADLDPETGGRIEPSGFHATVGYRFVPRLQGLARWERFQPDGLGPDQDLLIAGLNVTASRPVGLQVNYIVPTEASPRFHQLLANLQLDF